MIEQAVTIEKVSTIALNTTEVIFKTETPIIFAPGQYVTVTIPSLSGLQVKEQFRDFSVASDPGDKLHIMIAFRNSTSKFKQELLSADKNFQVLISGPKGVFTLENESCVNVVFIAGGIGVTPFLSIIRDIISTKKNIKPTLMYYNRSEASAAFLGELESYDGKINFIPVFGPMTDTEVKKYITSHPGKTIWYIAGPSAMVRVAVGLLKGFHVDDTHIKTEEFTGYE